MDNSNQTLLLEDIRTEASYQSLDQTSKNLPFAFAFDTASPTKANSNADLEKDSNFKLYKYVVYVYLIIIGFLLARSALQFTSGMTKVISIAIYAFSFFIWFYGKQALSYKSSGSQKIFQGLLIMFMIYHAFVCGRIILDSYHIMPNMTFSSFGLNAIFGILVPVVIYYEADKLRMIFEGTNILALYKQ